MTDPVLMLWRRYVRALLDELDPVPVWPELANEAESVLEAPRIRLELKVGGEAGPEEGPPVKAREEPSGSVPIPSPPTPGANGRESRRGYCSKCNHHAASNAHRKACLGRSRKGKPATGPEIGPLTEEVCPKCNASKLRKDRDGDVVCFACGYRRVGDGLGSLSPEEALKEVAGGRPPSHSGSPL